MNAFAMPHRLDWPHDGRDWPNRETSRFLRVGRIEWHVQVAGPPDAPPILLLHGTGASSHSFRDVLPRLAERFRVVNPDLPGHGFTRGDEDLSLDAMAKGVDAMLAELGVVPATAAGHSAGAAIALRLAMASKHPPQRVIGFNAALKPIEGDHILAPLARLLFLNPFVPRAFASFSRMTGATERLLDRTGSQIDRRGRELYARLVASPAHVAGALGMMANWRLDELQQGMPGIGAAVTLVATEDDPMVPASVSREAAARIPGCELIVLPSGGHLVHETRPDFAAQIIAERTVPKPQEAQP